MKTIAVIGLGSIGLRHAKNLRAMGHEVLGFDPDKSIKEFINPYGDSIHERADAIVVASPTSRHITDVMEAMGHALPVFCEKPIADRMPEFEASFRAIKMVGYNLRFHGCVKKAKEWLDEGRIGKPLWANFTLGQYSEKEPYLRDGVILNWSHEIDLALYLLGGATVAASNTRLTNGKDDISDILLTHESGCRSTIHLDYVTTPEQRYFTISGGKGHLFVNVKDRCCSLMENGKWTEACDGGDTWNDNYIEEMQAFLDRCDGKETIGCSGSEGLEVLKICLEVRRQAGLP